MLTAITTTACILVLITTPGLVALHLDDRKKAQVK